MTPPSLWNACDFVLQFRFKIAHAPGRMNTAADFLSRLDSNPKDKTLLQIRDDIQTTRYKSISNPQIYMIYFLNILNLHFNYLVKLLVTLSFHLILLIMMQILIMTIHSIHYVLDFTINCSTCILFYTYMVFRCFYCTLWISLLYSYSMWNLFFYIPFRTSNYHTHNQIIQNIFF